MSTTLEVNLTAKASGIILASTRFTDAETGLERCLYVSSATQGMNYEPAKSEMLPSFGNPQRALLILLLQAYESEFANRILDTQKSPKFARSLWGMVLKQKNKTSKSVVSRWLYTLVGITSNNKLEDWFVGAGNTSKNRSCWVGLGSKWKSTRLVVKMDSKEVPVSDYLQLAHQIEHGSASVPVATAASVAHFDLLVWNPAMGGFSRGGESVRHGDKIQLRVHTNMPAHVYVLWLDAKWKTVTLHPWSGSNWQPIRNDPAVTTLTVPDESGEDDRYSLQVDGAAGVEHVIVLASRDPIDRQQAQGLRNIMEGLKLDCRCPSTEVKVVLRFDRTSSTAKPMRTVRRLVAAEGVEPFQAQVASRLTPHFDQVLICTFKNEGAIRR